MRELNRLANAIISFRQKQYPKVLFALHLIDCLLKCIGHVGLSISLEAVILRGKDRMLPDRPVFAYRWNHLFASPPGRHITDNPTDYQRYLII